MVEVKFRYRDEYTHGEWSEQCGTFPSLRECIECYGLDQPDVDVDIYEVNEIGEGGDGY